MTPAIVARIVSVFVLITFARIAAAQAQPPPPDTGTAIDTKEPAQRPETDAEKPWAVDITVDVPSQYFYRGYNVVSKGWIVQPAIDFSYTVLDRDGLTITPHVAGWFNFTEEKGANEPQHFAEADLFAGVALGYANFELLVDYNFQGYPSGFGIDAGSGQVQEVQFVLSYDDGALWPDGSALAGLFPHVGYYREVEDRNDDDRNAYVEVGVEPTLREFSLGGRGVTISFPLVVGLSADGYYTDAAGGNETLGYYLAGVKAAVALDARWTLVGEVDYLRLEATSVLEANGGDGDAVVARVGVSAAL
jgi:hypothetical protein